MGQFPWGDMQLAPGGVENVFQYRGLSFNDRSTDDHWRVDSVEGFYDLPRTRLVEYARPDRHGVVIEDVYYGGRTINISGRIRAGNAAKLRQMEHTTKATLFYNQLESELRIKNRAGASLLPQDYTIWCRPVNASFSEQIRADGLWSLFKITFQAGDPRILGTIARERGLTFFSGFSYSDPIWNWPNYGNWYAKANVKIQQINNTTSWVLNTPKITLSGPYVNGIGVSYAGAATGTSGQWREIETGAFSYLDSQGSGVVRIVDQSGAKWGNQNAVSRDMAYPLMIPPVNFDPALAGRHANINIYAATAINSPIAVIRWHDTFL